MSGGGKGRGRNRKRMTGVGGMKGDKGRARG